MTMENTDPQPKGTAQCHGLIDPGILCPKKVVELIEPYGHRVGLLLERRRADEYTNYELAQLPIVYPEFNDNVSATEDCYSSDLWRYVLDDHQTFMLYDRTNKRIWETASFKLARLSILIQQSARLIKEKKPAFLIYNATPHNIFTWVFARTAEFYGSKIFYFQHSFLPWRYFLYCGLNRNATIFVPENNEGAFDLPSKSEQKLSEQFLGRKAGSSAYALPAYEKERLRRHKGRSFSISASFSQHYKRPINALNAAICYQAYKSLAVQPTGGKPLLIFFMHYQPERTTLPEAYGYAQQLIAISAIKSVLPNGVELFVKEHPSTFRNLCSWRERSPSYYRMLVERVGVHLLPMDYDSYEAIDNAWVVASIAGTVLYEALIRGRRALAFSPLGFDQVRSRHLHIYHSAEGLKAFFDSCLLDGNAEISPSMLKNIKELHKTTFSGLSDSSGSIEEVERSRRVLRTEAMLRGIASLFQSELRFYL